MLLRSSVPQSSTNGCDTVDENVEKDVDATPQSANTSSPTSSNLKDNGNPQIFNRTIVNLQEVYQIAAGLTLPYIFHPTLAFQVYFPGITNMWPFSSTPAFAAANIPSLAGKTILVTGANNGIGKETVLQLAKHNPQKIFLASRTESKGREAVASIKSQTSEKVDIEYLPLDLTSFPSIRKAVEQVNAKSNRLDILILNAGVMALPAEKTATGQDIQIGTNHVGHFLLTKNLLPTLQRTAQEPGSDVRVISLSSEAYNFAPGIDTIISNEKLATTGNWTRYGASKAANIMFAAELARRYPSMTSVSIHPGLIKTDLHSQSTTDNIIVRNLQKLLGPLVLQDVHSGALNSLWAAAGAKKSELKNGGYYTPVGKVGGNKWANDEGVAKKLWDWTEAEIKSAGY
jgi:NAD(P)-dependent dehydrogenase (short-subunit alcohol dehydrogenase family)